MDRPGRHLCIGCGICAAVCTLERIQMVYSKSLGHYMPSTGFRECDAACGRCGEVCPFVPGNPSTIEITKALYAGKTGMQHDEVLGYYLKTYVGFSAAHRLTSASGGLLTWLLERLLVHGAIDGALCVGPSPASPTLFDYRICRSVEELRACSGSCYQPVEISRALKQVLAQEGRYAVVALPCVARGLRLAMRVTKDVNRRIRFVFGLVCGGMKTRHYVEYLALRWLRSDPDSFDRIAFRYKKPGWLPSAITFAFWPKDAAHPRLLRFSDGIDYPFWNGSFNPQVCSCCDDVFAEHADAVFMDAWLEEFESKPDGHSLVLAREPYIASLLDVKNNGESTEISSISPSRVIDSQTRVQVVQQKRVLTGYNARAYGFRGIRTPNLRSKRGRIDQWCEAMIRRRLRSVTLRSWTNHRGDYTRLDRVTFVWRKLLNLVFRVRSRALDAVGKR